MAIVQVEFINHMTRYIEVHKVGCADVDKEEKRRRLNSRWVEDLEVNDTQTLQQAATAAMNASFGWEPGDEDDAPWSDEYVRIMPCCGARKTSR